MSRARYEPTNLAAASLIKETKLKSSLIMLTDVMREFKQTLETLEAESLTELKKIYPERPPGLSEEIDFYEEVRLFEIWLIQRALKYAGGRQTRAASLLGLKMTTLNSKIKTYHIEWREMA